jgi:hypothetical protein
MYLFYTVISHAPISTTVHFEHLQHTRSGSLKKKYSRLSEVSQLRTGQARPARLHRLGLCSLACRYQVSYNLAQPCLKLRLQIIFLPNCSLEAGLGNIPLHARPPDLLGIVRQRNPGIMYLRSLVQYINPFSTFYVLKGIISQVFILDAGLNGLFKKRKQTCGKTR